jgi:nitrogen fixation protein NifU and related proteins
MMYTDKVMEHFRNPKHMGEIPNADGTGKVGNPICGDLMQITIKVGRKEGEEYLEDIKVKTFGCVAAISSSDVLCDITKGMKLSDALKVTNNDVLDQLGEVPQQKKHCSVLAADALHRAIEDYRKKG